jgi:hypothetical protein
MHLLAFKLNQSAGAYYCKYASEAADQGDAILAGLGYNGTGDYFKVKGNKSGPDNSKALEIATILDRYNNNLIEVEECSNGSLDFTKREIVKQVDSASVETYPNPFNHVLNVKVTLDYSTSASILMFDTLGRLIMSKIDQQVLEGQNLLELRINESLAEGPYYLKLNTGKEIITKRVFYKQ